MGTSARVAEPKAKDLAQPERLAEEQAALRRVATLVASGATSAEVFSAVVREVAQVMHLPMVGLYRYDGDGMMTVLATWSDRPHLFQAGTRWPLDGHTMITVVHRTGRPARIEDYTDVPGEIAAGARESRLNATAGAPITVDGAVWGAIGVSSPDGPLPDRAEDQLAAFTELVATAIANTQAHDELTRLAEEQAALRRVATLVASGAQPAEVFEAVSAEVATLIPADGAALARFESDGTVTALSGWTAEGGYVYVDRRLPLEGTVSTVVLKTGRPGRIDDYTKAEGEAAEAARMMGWRSSVGAPVTVDGRLWGALVIASRTETPLPPDAEQRLTQFTELVATAIANSEAHEELERLAGEQAALRRVATLVAAGAPPLKVFEAVSIEVAALIPSDGSALTRFEDAGRVTAIGGWSREGGYSYVGNSYPLEGTVSGRVHETGRPARVDCYEDAPTPALQAARELGWRSSVAAPITVEGRLWGTLALASMKEEPLPRDTEERLVEFTELVATAIANSEAHEQLSRLADKQAALRRVATLAAKGAPLAEVAEAVGAEIGQLLDADGAGVSRHDDDGMFTVLGGWAKDGGYTFAGRRFGTDGSMSGLVIETGRPARIDSFDDRRGEAAAEVSNLGWTCAAGVPIWVEDRLWGVLMAYSKRAAPLPAQTENHLTEFTEIVATAIASTENREKLTSLADEQAALRRVATLAAQGAPPSEVFTAVGLEMTRVFGAEAASVTRFEGDAAFRAVGGWSSDGNYDLSGRRFGFERSISGLIFETRRPSRVDDFEGVPGEAAAYIRERGWRAAVGGPIFVEGSLWGALVVYSSSADPIPFDTETRVAKFAEIVATAIANTENREEITRLAEEQAALRRVATLAAQGAPPAEVFDAVCAEVAHLVQADGASITRFCEEDDSLVALTLWGNEKARALIGRHYPLEGSLSGLILEMRSPARIGDFWDRPGEVPAAAREVGWRSAVGTPIWVDGRIWGVLVVYSNRADPFPSDTETRLAKFTEIVTTAIASTENREEITRLAEEQAALRRVATLVAQGAPPAEVFEAVSAEVGRLVPADVAAISRFDPGGDVTTLGSWTRAGGYQIQAGEQFPLEQGTTGRLVYETHRPARLDNYESITSKRGDNPALRTGIGAPIIVEGRLWGVANIASWTDPLPADTEQRLMQFTELLATAIANAESRGELEASRARIVATADATRRRIERDLHDGAQQRLLSLALEVRAAQAAAPPELTEHRAELSHVAEGLTDVLDGLREIALGLHPAILAEGGLGAALKTLAQRSPLPVRLDAPIQGRLSEQVEVAAYYVVSEALTNAAKHSCGSEVAVDVVVRDEVLCVTVADDGTGGADPAGGSGLFGLKDRVAAIGGTLQLESRPGEGTTLVAELPLTGGSP